MSQTVDPPDRPEAPGRIQALDIIRGLAVMGILLGNIGIYLQSNGQREAVHSTADAWLHQVIALVVDGKFHALFALLFGASTVLFLNSPAGRGKLWAPWLRRMGALALFGALNMFVFGAPDVLMTYALFGTVLPIFLRLPQRIVLATGVLIGAAGNVVVVGYALVNHYGQATLTWPSSVGLLLTSQVLGHMLLGLWAQRAQLFTGRHNRPRIRWALSVLGLATLALWAFTLLLPQGDLANRLTSNLAIVPAGAYLLGLVLLLDNPRLRARLAPVADYGRIALTSYLTHGLLNMTLVAALVSSGPVTVVQSVALCVAVWIVQLLFARVWMSRLTYGPLEWVWRAVTHLRIPAMRKPQRLNAALGPSDPA